MLLLCCSLWAQLGEYLYWFSPFGNGLDCHRTWEAIYTGSVPIVPRSVLDSFYDLGDLPVLVVDSILDVTPELLLAHAPRFAAMRRDFGRKQLLRAYWRYQMLAFRSEKLSAVLTSTGVPMTFENEPDEKDRAVAPLVRDWNRDRPRCWGNHLN
jgi:hypothetical protein